ncbi:MAG: hypothetical protein ACK5LS_02160 [Propioniciclava sp.]
MNLWPYLGISAEGATAVVVSAVILYTVLGVLVRHWGARLLGGRSALALVIAAGLGAIAARATLGTTPTLMGGLIAIVTMGALEALMGALRRGLFPRKRGEVVMVGADVDARALHRHGIGVAAVWESLRQHGIHGPEEVGVIILEVNGSFSHLTPGIPIDPRVLTGVKGVDAIPSDWISAATEVVPPAEDAG